MPCRFVATRPRPIEYAGKALLLPCCKRVCTLSRRVRMAFSASHSYYYYGQQWEAEV